MAGEDGQSKVFRAFADLIKHTYPHLKMLRGVKYSEDEITTILTQVTQGLFGDGITLSEAQRELLSMIQSNHRGGVRTTVNCCLRSSNTNPTDGRLQRYSVH